MSSSYGDVKVQKGLSIARERPGQFCGNYLENDYDCALVNLFREIFSNSNDEWMAHFFSEGISVKFCKATNRITVIDRGRGMPHHIHAEEGVSNIHLCVGVMYAGGKYNKDENSTYQFSQGLNGVGSSVTNALSDDFFVSSVCRSSDGKTTKASARYSKGVLVEMNNPVVVFDQPTGTTVSYVLDKTILPFDYQTEHLNRFCSEMAYLYEGLRVSLEIYETEDSSPEIFKYYEPNGIETFRKKLSSGIRALAEFPIITGTDPKGNRYEISLAVLDSPAEEYVSFVNGCAIEVASAPVVASRQALAKAILQYIEEQATLTAKQKKLSITTADVRSGVACVIKLLHLDPAFHSQTKTKLINTDISQFIGTDFKDKLYAELLNSPSAAQSILEQILAQVEARDEAEKARQRSLSKSKTTRKAPEEGGISYDIYTPPLEDNPDINDLYLFEGKSAAEALRDPLKLINPETGKMFKFNVAILALKGISLNTLEIKLSDSLKNAEIATLYGVSGLDREAPEDLSNLNFRRFIIATDEDSGGRHISTLLTTFFATHFPEVIRQGRLFRVHTPFYEILNTKTKELHFVYHDEDLEERIRSFGLDPNDVNKTFTRKRIKGLGELGVVAKKTLVLNPRLVPLQYDDIDKLRALCYMFSGSDFVDQRREYIFSNGLLIDE